MKRLLQCLLLLTCFPVFSQTGPGGVGSTNGSSSLVLWLDANAVSGSNGASITNWPDKSGYGYNFSGGNGATLTKPATNGKAALTFNGTSHYFERTYTANISPTSYTVFTAANVTSTGNYKAILSNRDDPPQSGFILYATPTDNDWSYWTGTGTGWNQIGVVNSTHGFWASQVMTFNNATNDKELYVNEGTAFTSNDAYSNNTTRPFRIGAGVNESTPDFYYSGDIGEVIIFNTVLNSAQRVIVQNYLAAKYNFTLVNNDLFVNDNAGNGNFDTDVAAIGRIDASNQHTDAQGSIVRILNAGGLGDGEFLFWGHNNGLLQGSNTTDVPSGVAARFDRVWRANEVNTSGSAIDVGSIDIRWDLNNLGPVTVTDLRLLVDTDNDGVFTDETPISGATSLGGGIYAFTGVTAITNSVRFTLATINSAQTPLPIELAEFNVTAVNKTQALVTWKTATENNNAYFTIERSKNNINWEEVKRVPGAGNSSTPISYSLVDQYPFTGTSFYRIRQTDFDNRQTVSAVKSINIKKSDTYTISIYPNPTVQDLVVKSDEEELKQLSIFSIVGQNVTASVSMRRINSTHINLNLAALQPGVYTLKTKNTISKIIKQ